MPCRPRHGLSIALAAVGCAVAIAACGPSGSSSAAGTGSSDTLAIKFADCMRSRGVPNFPDPGSPVSGINQQAPAFQSAQQSCEKLLPGGGRPQPFSESQKLAIVATSKCMRAHGVPDYPDPTLSATRPRVSLELPATINPQAPAFLKAAKACAGVGDGPPP